MPKKVKANGKTFTFEDDVTNEQIGIAIDEYFAGVKKKVATQPTAPKKQLASPTQTQTTPTSSDTEETQLPVVSDGLGGPTKMKTFTGFTPEEQQTLQAKPVPKISKSAALIGKKLTLQKELSTAKVTPENQDEILRKTDELASVIKEQDAISHNRLSEIEQQFKTAKNDEAADIEADKRLNDALTNTGIWNNVKSASIDMYNAVLDQPALRAIGADKLKADTDVLSNEKKEVLKDAAKNKIELSDIEVEERAKQLYKNKQKDYIETDNLNSFLDNLDESDKNLLKQSRKNLGEHLQENNLKEEKAINAYEVIGNKKIKEYKTIEQELLKYKNNNQPLPKDLYDSYVSLGNEIVGIGNSIQKRQSVINKNKEDLGTVKQEFDLLKRRYGDIDNAVTNIGLGGTKILNGILGFTNYAAKFAGGAQGQIYSLAGQQVTDKINDYISDEESQLRKSVESIESPEGFVNYASDIMSKQIPNLVATSTGIGGLGVIGISSTGEKFTEMNKEVLDGKATYSPLQMAVAPALWGSAEVISEIPTLSILTKGGRVFDSIVKNEGDLIKKTVKEKAKEWAKDWSVDMGKEVAGEEFTNFAQNFTNKYVLGKKDVGLLDNTGTVLKDTFTLTNILKAAPHIAGAILKSHQDNSDLNVLDENSRKIIDFSKQLENESLNDTEISVITKQIEKATAQNSKTIANTIEKVNNMPDDVYRKIIDLNNKVADIKTEAVAINEGNLPNKSELIKSLESDYRAAQTERNALIDAKYEAKPIEEAKPTVEVISPETSSNYGNLTENKEGDFVFFHVGGKGYETIKKSTGGTTATSREEAGALSKVGGVAMYYTKPGDTERMVSGEAKYAVTIPKERVYDANTDPNNYTEEAKARHEEENPGKAFDANSKLAYITKIAGENGYDMVVSEWMGKTRAQTTKEFAPTDVQLKEGDKIAKSFEEEYIDNTAKGYKSIVPESKEAKLKAVYEAINVERSRQNKYDKLYRLYGEDLTNTPQEEITKLVEESDLSQEVKDMYAEALAYEPGIRRTEVPVEINKEVGAVVTGENVVTPSVEEKVSEENIVYHGTTKKFDIFDDKNGIYFTPDKKYAEHYSKDMPKSGILSEGKTNENSRLIEATINIKNPKKFGNKENQTKPTLNNFYKLSAEKISEYKKQGYDGLILEVDGVQREQVVFDKSQINIKENPSEVKPTKTTVEPTNNTEAFRDKVKDIPESGKVGKYLSGETIEKVEGEAPRNLQEIDIMPLVEAGIHGKETVAMAKEVYGDKYVEKTLEFLDTANLKAYEKALLYVSLENEMFDLVNSEPNNVGLKKLQDLVRAKSQQFLRESSLAINMGRLRAIMKDGFNYESITDQFLSGDQLRAKKDIEKAIQSDANAIQKEYEGMVSESDLEQLIFSGVEKQINEIYKKLPTARRVKADKAIAALEKIQKKLRGKAYDATIGLPIALIDSGINVIKNSIKAGVNIADAIELGINHIKEKYGKDWVNEGMFRDDMTQGFKTEGVSEKEIKAKELSNKDIVNQALIEAGFGKEITVKGKKRNVLDWKKLAGEEGSVDKIRENVEKIIGEDAAKDLVDEYNDLRASIIEKSLNDLERRNIPRKKVNLKTSAKKLAEIYNQGAFEKESDTYDHLMNTVLGMNQLDQKSFDEAKKLAKSLAELFSQKDSDGNQLNQVYLKQAERTINKKIERLLSKVAWSESNGAYKATVIAKEFIGLAQRNALVSVAQAIENTTSGYISRAFKKVGFMFDNVDTKSLKKSRNKLASMTFKDITLGNGLEFGDVTSPFITKSKTMDLIVNASDSRLYHALTSTALGKPFLESADSMHKAALAQGFFHYNLIKILRKKGYSKSEAKNYVSEQLTGQSFDDALATSKQIIDKINENAGKKVIPDSKESVYRFASDLVNEALVQGNKITIEELEASLKSAETVAGFELGHEPNNIISKPLNLFNSWVQTRTDKAVKDKKWNDAAALTAASIVTTNILNPYIGGGTNWTLLAAQKAGIPTLSTIYWNIKSRGSKLDLSTEEGMKNLEKDLKYQLLAKNANTRMFIGAAVTLAAFALAKSTGANDDLYDWLKKNPWANKYMKKVNPPAVQFMLAQKDKKLGEFLGQQMNIKADAFDEGKKIQQAMKNAASGKTQKALGGAGQLLGSRLSTPIIPWRVVRDVRDIYRGLNGLPEIKHEYKASGFASGYFQGGMVEQLGLRPEDVKDTSGRRQSSGSRSESGSRESSGTRTQIGSR